eukprot:TRINITY_DN121492_c0_g1_i1.p1 TRINITY_DN121492_c0_g1~~TRINITY_DN121492_c0_g1_i1.p1  ORF type:complete len:774 (+),score=45.66 TRINITY_DN121492_c0_g1_i1:266-2587(+)
MRLPHSPLKPLWDFFKNSYKHYPKLTPNIDLSPYYRRHSKSAPISFLIITFALILCNSLSAFLAILRNEPLGLIWAFSKVDFFIYGVFFMSMCYCLYIINGLCAPQNKHNITYQLSVRRKLQICGLIPTCTLIISPTLLPESDCTGEITFFMWAIFSIMQLHICIWMVDGILLRTLLMCLFNSGYCAIAIFNGVFTKFNTSKFVVPVILSMAFFVVFDKYEKENFILKYTLYKQRKMYEKHLEKFQDPIIILDKHNLLFANEVSKRKIASTLDDFWAITSFIVSGKGERLNDVVSARLQDLGNDKVVQHKYYQHNTDSEFITINRTFMLTMIESTLYSQNKIVSLSFQDLTEELVREESRVEEKYKNMLFFSLSHELRTPLNIFQAFLCASKKLMTSPSDQELHQNAKGAWRYLRNKISDILDYAQMLSDEFILHNTRFSLNNFIKHLQKMTYFLLSDKRSSISLVFHVEPNVNDNFIGDRDRLEQVLFNFLTNAVKYTTSGTISLHVYQKEPKLVTFDVTDTGQGMSPQQVSSLFSLKDEPREATHGARSSKSKAGKLSGLGLTVSKMICARMGSNITVTSKLNKGSTFSFTLSEEPKDDNIIPEEPFQINKCKERNVAASARKPTEKPKTVILIVDDNTLNRSVVKEMVEKLGFVTAEAENGKSAIDKLIELEKATKHNADILIFMDLDMPVMDGIEATLKIRRMKKIRQPLIVALTAYGSEKERTKCMEAGMNGFAGKPLTKDSLLYLLNDFQLTPQAGIYFVIICLYSH